MTTAVPTRPGSPPPEPASPPEPPRREPLRVQALRVAAWRLGGYGVSQVVRLAGNILLARLLLPQHFGVAALVSVWAQGLEMFSDLGLGPGVIRSRRGSEADFVNTAWTLGLVRGVVLCAVGCMLAWPASLLYREPALAVLLPVSSLGALIGATRSMSIDLLSRNMRGGFIAAVDLGGQVTGAAVAITWAWLDPSPWALVVGGVAATAARSGLSHLCVLVPPRLRWEREARRELLHFGKWIFLSTVITFFAMQGDKLIGGGLVPMDLFGVYTIAFGLALMPKQVVNRVSRGALYPLMAAAARENEGRLVEQVRRARYVLLPVTAALVLCLVACGRLFFGLLYPPAYAAAGWITQWLAAFLWFNLLTEVSDRVLLALGDSRTLALSNAVRTAVTIGAIVAGWHAAGLHGFIAGLALGPLAGYLVVAVAMQRRGLPVLAADLAYTVGLAGACAAALLVFDLASPETGTLQVTGAACTLLIAGQWVAARLWRVYGPGAAAA